tara:strand:- start:1630 stop:3171 length:1542 start_codon:yes stop_codon:yes gene_type:complete
MHYNKTLIFTSVLLFFVPIISFLNEINLPQILASDILLIFVSQFLILSVVVLISFTLHKLLLKSILSFENFFLINIFTLYLLFFFKNLKDTLFLFESNSQLDVILTFFIYGLIYFLLIYFEKKHIKFLSRFLKIYVLIMFLLLIYNLLFFQLGVEKRNNKSISFNNLTAIDLNLIRENSKNENIFFIILDGMINLEYAKKLNVIESKQEIIRNLKKKDFLYKENFFSNYDTSYLSIASLLQASYPVIEQSKKYNSRKDFFPFFVLNEKKDNDLFRILRKTKKKLIWLGNEWAFCQDNSYVKCLNSDFAYKKISRLKLFYSDSIFSYILNAYSPGNKNKEALNFLMTPNFSTQKPIQTKGDIYLLHVLSPHPPYIFDQNCNIRNETTKNTKSNDLQYYSYAYNCLIKSISSWTAKINKINKNNMILILGDHGWSFNENLMKKNDIKKDDIRFKPFFAYKMPKRCEDLRSPNSIVNVLRFALICAGNKDLNYIKDLKFQSFYESSPNYGKVFLKN